MIGRIAAGTLLGALVLMIWGYVYWDFLVPPNTAFQFAPNQPELAKVLRSHLPRAGTYFLPHDSGHEETPHQDADPHQEMVNQVGGDIAMIHYAPEVGNPLALPTYIGSFLHFIVTTLLASLLLVLALPALRTYRRRVGFVFGIAVFGIAAFRITEPFWYRLPFEYFLYVSFYLATGWFAAALVIGAIVRPREE